MAPDQTIRVMESNFDICDGQIRFFSAFLMEIFDRFEVFRLYSLSKGWKSSTFRNFPIIFPFQRMEILDISNFSDYIPFPKDGNSWHFEIFRLYSLSKGWKSSTFRNFPITVYSLFKGWDAFDLHIDKLIWLRSNKKRLVYGKKRWRVIRFEYHFTMHLQYYRSLMFTETTEGQGRDNNIFHIILHFVIFFLLMYSLSSSWRIEVKIGFYVCLKGVWHEIFDFRFFS